MTPEEIQKRRQHLESLIAKEQCKCLLAYDECRKCRLEAALKKLVAEEEK